MASLHTEPILHVVVVGFHHKKGAQVEYSYPPLVEGQPVDSNEIPALWKHLPSLVLPDGAHNYDKDTVYFHLPSVADDRSTVFGVSCYRQIDAKDVKNKGSEVTRNTIQKSVCVLSSLPLYGLIEAKLEIITYAWFKEKDFTQVSLLEETYRQLQSSCTQDLIEGSQVFLGLSCRELVMKMRHKIIMLFKLLLLERKILVYGSPVKPVCTTLLSLLSLFPDMIEYGLKESAAYSTNRTLSPTMKNVTIGSNSEEFLEIHYKEDNDGGGDHEQGSKSPNKEKHSVTGEEKVSNANSNNESKSACYASANEIYSDKSSQNNIASTPSPIYDKSENELSEKRMENKIAGIHSQEIENNQAIVKETQGFNESPVPCVTSQLSPKNTEDIDFESQVQPSPPFLTHTTQPQPSSVTPNKNNLLSNSPINDLSSIRMSESTSASGKDAPNNTANTTSQGYMSETISKDTLTSEATASDFGRPSSHMEDLLYDDHGDECFSWQDDKLMLAVDKMGTGNMAHHFDGRLTFEPEETEDMKRHETSQEKSVKRMDSTNSRASQGSLTSMASDLGEAGVKVFSGVKSRLSSLWDSNLVTSEVPDHATDQPEVHHFEGHLHSNASESSAGHSTDSSPKKSPTHSDVIAPVSPTSLTIDECGFPLPIFTKSVLCHPYLSLQYYDLLQDVNVRGFLIGASNMLFRQKKHLIDVIVLLPDLNLEVHDETLRRQLVLSTADLRFADYLVKTVCGDEEESESVYEETEWEGGDEWLRAQFKLYLASLLVTMRSKDNKLIEDFNMTFAEAFKTTHCYKLWNSVERRGLTEAPPGHPFQGQLSMQDIRMRFAQNERGKKFIDAAGQTGKVAMQTGKAIGGAFTTAKSAVSSTVGGWFSNLRKWSSTDAPEELSSAEEAES